MNKLIVPLRKQSYIVHGDKRGAVDQIRRNFRAREIVYRNRQDVSFTGLETADRHFLLVTYQKRRAKNGVPSHWIVDVTFVPMQLLEFMPAGTVIRQRPRFVEMTTPRNSVE